MSCCCGEREPAVRTNSFIEDATKPLVQPDAHVREDARSSAMSGLYGSLQSPNQSARRSSAAILYGALLDPAGHLSLHLRRILKHLFARFAKRSGAVMTRFELSQYLEACYPNLKDKAQYESRADMLLKRFGYPWRSVRAQLEAALADAGDEKDESGVASSRTRSSSSTDDAIDMEQIQLSLTLQMSDADLVLTRPRFFLYYRKLCVDHPMMARLELVAVGHEEFRTGMLIDRTKHVDVLAYRVQQLRNRMATHIEEKRRMENARPPEECGQMLAAYIRGHTDPFDMDDRENIFRRRKPLKFSPWCHVCCCCFVFCARCCCE